MLHLRPATESDIPSIVDLSTAAFDPTTDAIARHLTPSSPQARSDFRQWQIARKSARLQAERTATTVVVDDALNGRIVGYSVWERPTGEQDESNNREPPKIALDGVDERAFIELRRILNQDERESFGERGTRDVWREFMSSCLLKNQIIITNIVDLTSIGVHPQQQRRGIGNMLISWGVQQASSQGKDCYLVATPNGLPLYLATGFEQVRTVDIFGTPHISMKKKHSPN